MKYEELDGKLSELLDSMLTARGNFQKAIDYLHELKARLLKEEANRLEKKEGR